MNTQKSLVIANPCHANWNKMTATEKGRFCASCTKEVVDFTNKKKEDIIEYLENYKGEGQTCGQFSASQIDKVGKNYINSSFFKRMGISFMALLGFFSFKEAKGQQKMGKVAIKGDVSYQDYNQSHHKTDVKIFGTVRTLSGEKISGAEIRFNHEGKQLAITKTIANGTFAIQLKVDKSMKIITMYTKADGYEMKINVIPEPQKERIKVDIIMESEIMVLGEIAIQVDTVKTDEIIKESILTQKDSVSGCQETYSPDSTEQNEEINEIIPENPENRNGNDSTEISREIPLINDEKWLRVYPNPTAENATITWKNEEESLVEIFDMNQKLIWSTRMKGSKTVFNTSHLANGNYLVKITSKISGKSESAQLTVIH